MHEASKIADDLWIVDGSTVRFFTLPFPTRMTVIQLSDGSLLIHSPIELTGKVREMVESIGVPRYLVSPNKLHHLFLEQWQSAYENALTFSAPGLQKKRPDLIFHGELGDHPNPAWEQDVDQLLFKGSRVMTEVVFFHRSSRTVIFGDLVENFDPQTLTWLQRLLARFGGVLAPNGQTPWDWRQSFLKPHDEARESLQKILSWHPQAVVMCHGLPVYEHATPFIESAFAWLNETSSSSAGSS